MVEKEAESPLYAVSSWALGNCRCLSVCCPLPSCSVTASTDPLDLRPRAMLQGYAADPQGHVLALTPNVMTRGSGVLGRRLRAGLMHGISAFIKEAPRAPSPPAMWGHSEKRAVCDPGSGFSPVAESGSAWILDVPASKTESNVCCL